MRKLIIIAVISATSALNAQSFVAGWDFDSVPADASSMTANWGDQAGSASLSWTHSPANPPVVFNSEFGVSAANNSDIVNNSFTFLAGGVDANTSFTGFSDNFGAAEQGFQSFTAGDTMNLSFSGTNFVNLTLTFAFAANQGSAFSVQTIDLGAFDGVASANYQFTTALNGVYDNFAITGTVVPEPSTFAAIAGVLVLGFAAIRRRR